MAILTGVKNLLYSSKQKLNSTKNKKQKNYLKIEKKIDTNWTLDKAQQHKKNTKTLVVF